MRRLTGSLLFAAVVFLGAMQAFRVFGAGGQALMYYGEKGPALEALYNMEEQERSRGKAALADLSACPVNGSWRRRIKRWERRLKQRDFMYMAQESWQYTAAWSQAATAADGSAEAA